MVIHYDNIHIMTMFFLERKPDGLRMRGATEGTLIFKKDEAAAKASIDDPMKRVDMVLSYGVSYDLLRWVVSEFH